MQQYRNLPLQSSREDDSFENQLQKEHEAQKLFLKVDASRRMSTALNHRCRPLREFVTGDLVYYFRRDRKDSGNSKYGGRWHGPARVLAHEKTSDFCDGQHAGSVVWISHAGVLFRCSPEQLRFVNHDIKHLDQQINGPFNFHTMLEAVSRQQRYVDISQDDLSELQKAIDMEENRPHFRAFSKKSLAELQRPLEERVPIVAGPHVGEKRGFEEVVGSRGGQCEHGHPRFRADVSGGAGKPGDDERSSKRQALQKHLRGPLLQRLGRGTHQESGPSQQSHEGLRDLPSTSADSRTGIGRKRRPSTSVDTYEDRERLQELEVRAARKGPEPPSGGGRRDESVVPHRGLGAGHHRTSSERSEPVPTDEPDGRHHEPDPDRHSDHEREGAVDGGPGANDSERSLQREISLFQDQSIQHVTGHEVGHEKFVSFVDRLDVIEMELCLAPRDVHFQKGIWVVNAKARKGAEVVLRKLNKDDQELFEVAMKKELDSFLSSEAVQICSSHGISPERVMQMRWVYTWKSVDEGDQTVGNRKAKARLIIKGYQDPRLLTLPRESPTLSVLGRNLLLACAACFKMLICSGDIKTAFLQGSQTELEDRLYGEPTPEVRQLLNMKDHEILRISKAIYGLLNAPKRW